MGWLRQYATSAHRVDPRGIPVSPLPSRPSQRASRRAASFIVPRIFESNASTFNALVEHKAAPSVIVVTIFVDRIVSVLSTSAAARGLYSLPNIRYL